MNAGPDLEDLPAATREATLDLLLALGDDEFVAGHRLTDWVAVGPTMEVDNSLASIAQDEMGHARLWYELIIEARGGTLDDLALNRPPGERRNTVLVEGAHEDFADAIAVAYLYDQFEQGVLESLAQGDLEPVSARAEKALNEEPYHREHADRWLDRLVATEEGRRRLTRAFETNLPIAADLFAFDVDAAALADAGVLAIPLASIRADWQATVGTRLADLPLDVDEAALDAVDEPPEYDGRAGEHTDELTTMLDEMHPDDLVGDHPVLRYEGES